MSPEGDRNRTIVVMGVSGTGKSTVAAPLSRHLGWTFLEGDAFHPQANVDKMSNGVPLTDEDRWPWLRAIGEQITATHAVGDKVVVACSALRRAYRDVLREADPDILFVHLAGNAGIIASRMAGRSHFMKPEMLQSQLDTLEPLENDERHIVIDISDSRAKVNAAVLAGLSLVAPQLDQRVDHQHDPGDV